MHFSKREGGAAIDLKAKHSEVLCRRHSAKVIAVSELAELATDK